MQILDAQATRAALPYPRLIDAIAATIVGPAQAPPRIHHAVPRSDGDEVTLILMPAWQADGHIGVKLVTVSPRNGERGLPAICASYMLMDGDTGVPRLMIDGPVLTARRTAAVSALAAHYLAPEDCRVHLILGAGAVAANVAVSHRTLRPIERTMIWSRRPEKAHALCAALRQQGCEAEPVDDLYPAIAVADMVTTATLASDPVLKGAYLKADAHLDLIGAYLPHMREVDDDAIAGAIIYADNPEGALHETGELSIPLASGVIERDAIRGSLADLVRAGGGSWRRPAGRTVFKSVGMALCDFAAANCVLEGLDRR